MTKPYIWTHDIYKLKPCSWYYLQYCYHTL